MKNLYKINNSIERLNREESTLFLDKKELEIIKRKINKSKYNIYSPYEESDKVILYKKKLPKVLLYKINCNNNIRHQDILGSLYNIGVDMSYIGDIIKYQDNFYFYILENVEKYIIENFNMISNYKINLEPSYIDNYKREYSLLELVTTSLRIDNIVSIITGDSRKKVLEKFKNKEIILNNKDNIKPSYFIKENDVFSIRKYGKYKYVEIKNKTKKDKLIIKILKYK